MTILLDVTRGNGEENLVNLDAVETIEPDRQGAKIFLRSGRTILVRAGMEDLIAQIAALDEEIITDED